jgi:hydroxyacylglutathione hydrolase
VKIAPGVFLAASGNLGVSLTHDNDCNAYAVRCGAKHLLIDCGVGLEPETIAQNLAFDDIRPGGIERLLLTHYHLDHCGGAHWFRENFGAAVAASAVTAQALESGDEAAVSLEAARKAGAYGPEVHLESCKVDEVLYHGQRLNFSDASVEVLATPGHSRDMLSFLVRTPEQAMLFSGDTVFFDGRVLLSDTPDCDVPALCRSIRLLAEQEFDGFYPGHCLWSNRGGRRHVEKALSWITRLLLPPSLL